MQRNKRVVISGSPGSGKTAVIECLKNKGYSILEEFSRSLIKDYQSRGITNLFLSAPLKFSEQLLEVREKQFIDSEKIFQAKSQVVFFDRGIHDTYAYLKATGQENLNFKEKVYSFEYDLVFLLTPWGKIFKKDNERLENFSQAKMYYPYIKKAYSVQHKVIKLPQGSIEERVFFIESFMNNNNG